MKSSMNGNFYGLPTPSERDVAVGALREAGLTYRRIGELFSISINRTIQIHQRWLRYKNQPTGIGIHSLSIRTINCLIGARINTMEKLRKCSDKKLLGIRNFGMCSLLEIKELLKRIDADDQQKKSM